MLVRLAVSVLETRIAKIRNLSHISFKNILRCARGLSRKMWISLLLIRK